MMVFQSFAKLFEWRLTHIARNANLFEIHLHAPLWLYLKELLLLLLLLLFLLTLFNVEIKILAIIQKQLINID